MYTGYTTAVSEQPSPRMSCPVGQFQQPRRGRPSGLVCRKSRSTNGHHWRGTDVAAWHTSPSVSYGAGHHGNSWGATAHEKSNANSKTSYQEQHTDLQKPFQSVHRAARVCTPCSHHETLRRYATAVIRHTGYKLLTPLVMRQMVLTLCGFTIEAYTRAHKLDATLSECSN